MPRATVLKTTERFELKTLPAKDGEDAGFVELRRLSFGEKLEKDAEAMKLRFDVNSEKTSAGDLNAEVSMINVIATALEFSRCIMEHNLEDENGNKLDLTKSAAVRLLDPRVGAEIQGLIGDMNDYEATSKRSEVDAEGK